MQYKERILDVFSVFFLPEVVICNFSIYTENIVVFVFLIDSSPPSYSVSKAQSIGERRGAP